MRVNLPRNSLRIIPHIILIDCLPPFCYNSLAMRKSGKTSALGKTSFFAAKPVQAGARIHAKPGDRGVCLGAKPGDRGVRLSKEVAANFRAWFERNFVNRRAGRIGHVSYFRAGAFDDRPGDGMWYAEALGRAWEDYRSPLTASETGYLTDHPLVAFQLAAGITDTRGLRCMIRGLTLRTNSLQRKAYRGRYYVQENARRRMLAAERRKITRRTTTNPCPTPEAFREAFARVGESVESKLLFGGMVHDLACYVDSCLRYDGSGNIIGRNGGIKAWISENVPELHPRYKTIMRYKALAMRLRQAMGVKDPEPTSALLEGTADETSADENYSAQKSHLGRGGNVAGEGNRSEERDNRRGERDNRRGERGNGSEERDNRREERDNRRGERGNGLIDMGGKHRDVGDRGGERGGRSGNVVDMGMENMRRRMKRRKERLRSLLDGCANTFKDVLARIDVELERMCSGQMQNWTRLAR